MLLTQYLLSGYFSSEQYIYLISGNLLAQTKQACAISENSQIKDQCCHKLMALCCTIQHEDNLNHV